MLALFTRNYRASALSFSVVCLAFDLIIDFDNSTLSTFKLICGRVGLDETLSARINLKSAQMKNYAAD